MIFSVVMPAYNRAHTISRAIQSVLNQSFTDFELIIVDDFSSDSTVKVVESFTDDRIRLLRMNENKGASAARNFGIRSARGCIISFLDSDDAYEESILEETYKLLYESPDTIGFMWTGVTILYETKKEMHFWNPVFLGSTYQTFLHSLSIGTNAGISIKKAVFDQCGYFDESLPAAEDTEFFLRISKKFDYTYSDKPLITVYRIGDDRLSINYAKIAKAYNIFIPNHLDAIIKSRKLMLRYYYKLMWLNYHLGNKKIARKYLELLFQNKIIKLRVLFVFILFEIFPTSFAVLIHKKISG